MDRASPPNPSFDPLATMPRSASLELAITDLAAGWAEGRNPLAESHAERIASDGPDALVELVYHEFCLAEAAGLAPESESYFRRFPKLREPLDRLFNLHRAFDDSTLRSWSIPAEKVLPVAGYEIGPYRLLREMGRGGLARVFLAEQSDLNDRLVVLKVSARPSLEAVLQAKASHPHIVEVLRYVQTDDGGLHLIAMPFLGGATLAAVLARETSTSRRGFLDALDAVSAAECLSGETSRSATRVLLAPLPRTKLVAWMVARLAEALEHAARLGITHGDLKPANILIAADARPLLFDFNLAADWRSADADSSGPTGGTLAYMAPERLRALADPKSARPPRPADRQRADIYALGLVLQEMLTIEQPRTPEFTPSTLRPAAAALAESRERADVMRWHLVRQIPAGLKPILARCLAPNPADRYGNMAELAADLDLWREDRPTLHAKPLPKSRLWIRRQRAGVAVAAALIVVASIAGIWTWSAMSARLRRQAEWKLNTVWDSGDGAAFRGRRFGAWQLDDDATAEISRRNLDRYGVFETKDWRLRDDVRSLGEADRIDLEMWLAEQAWRLASAWAKRPNSPDAWRGALALLERSPDWAAIEAFANLRGSLRSSLGLPSEPVLTTRPADWLEDYAEGIAREATDPYAAAAAYTKVLANRPNALWPHYRAAAVASRLNQHAVAAEHLARCLQRRPANSAILIQRGGCLLSAGQNEAALASCNRALELDPDNRDAYLILALVRIHLEQTSAAQADIDRFAALSRAHPVEAWEGLATFDHRATESGGTRKPNNRLMTAAETQATLAAQLERQGKIQMALAAYDKAVEFDPENLQARVMRAALLRKERRVEGINDMADILEHRRFPELIRQNEPTLRIAHFVVEHRLRNGAIREAQTIAERALELALKLRPEGTQESPLVAESRYALARALAQDAEHDPVTARRVANLLIAAGQSDRRFLDEKFKQDKFFNGCRKVLAAWLP